VFRRWQAILGVCLLMLAIFSSSYNTIRNYQANRNLQAIQVQMQHRDKVLEERRFKAELRACKISQTTVRNERRIITRSIKAQRRDGTLTRERLNFYTVTLRDLKVPSCTPLALGFPQFE
jgi:hypothetical protein